VKYKNPEMKNKVCVITGATSGIGKLAAISLAKKGTELVLVCRDTNRAKELIEEIQKLTGNSKVNVLNADLSQQSAIRQVVDEIKKQHPIIDILVNNAGIAVRDRRLSADGIELTFAVNHLAYFLLTNLLLETIKSSAPARIINVSSEAHRNAKLDFDNLQSEKSFSGFGAYSITKLCNLLFTYELARRLTGTGVTVNAFHPGYLNTNIFREARSLLRFLVRLTAGNPQRGADGIAHLATAPELDNVTGKYFKGTQIAQSSPISHNQAAAEKLWEISSRLTNLSS
jgi:NAD(P)-dependent dehydrogenase (short-subunit alcohol dehydrogenase family)